MKNIGSKETRRNTNESTDQIGDQISPRMSNNMIHLDIAKNSKPHSEKLGIGVVAMDWRKQIKASCALSDRKSGNSMQDEAEGSKLALIKARELGWQRIHITCSSELVQQLKAKGSGDANLNSILKPGGHQYAHFFDSLMFLLFCP